MRAFQQPIDTVGHKSRSPERKVDIPRLGLEYQLDNVSSSPYSVTASQAMPDGDYYRRSPRRVWKSAHRMVAALASAGELAGPARRALTHTLRRGGGLPGLVEAADIVTAVTSGQKSVRRALDDLQSLERAVGRSPNATLGVDASRRVLAELSFGGVAPGDAQLALAERTCWGLLEHHFLDLAALNFVGGRFANLSEARQWDAGCRAEFEHDVHRIAVAVARQPNAKKLRAPARRRPRQTTANLLHQPVPAG